MHDPMFEDNFGSYVINEFCTLLRSIYDFPGLQYSTYLWIIKLNFFPRLLCFFLFQVFERRQTLSFCPVCFRAGKFDLKRKALSLNLHKFVFFFLRLTVCREIGKELESGLNLVWLFIQLLFENKKIKTAALKSS